MRIVRRPALSSRVLRLYVRTQMLRSDEAGLTMLAYALGAAAVLAPVASMLFGFGTDTAAQAGEKTDALFSP